MTGFVCKAPGSPTRRAVVLVPGRPSAGHSRGGPGGRFVATPRALANFSEASHRPLALTGNAPAGEVGAGVGRFNLSRQTAMVTDRLLRNPSIIVPFFVLVRYPL